MLVRWDVKVYMLSSAPYALHSNIDKAVIEHNRAVLPWLRRGAAISHVITINDSNDFDAALPGIRQFWKILTTESTESETILVNQDIFLVGRIK